MVQEVQTWVGITNENTLETIEAIGTSSFKIKEWRQTTARYTVGRSGTCRPSSFQYRQGETDRWSEEQESSYIVETETWGNQDFQIKDAGVRVPTAWTYECHIYWGANGVNNKYIIKVKVGKTVYYSKEIDNPSWMTYDEATFYMNLWKFDIVKVVWVFYYGGSNDHWVVGNQTGADIILKQL